MDSDELVIHTNEHPLQLRVVVQQDRGLLVQLGAESCTVLEWGLMELARFLRDSAGPCEDCIALETHLEVAYGEVADMQANRDRYRALLVDIVNAHYNGTAREQIHSLRAALGALFDEP